MTDRMEKAIEYRDVLKEIIDLERQIFGEEKATALPLKPGRKKGSAVSVKVDRGKLLALHNAGWNNAKIAEELKCAERTVYNILWNMKNVEGLEVTE